MHDASGEEGTVEPMPAGWCGVWLRGRVQNPGSIEDVEAADPERDGGGEDEHAGVERAAHGDPGGGGSDAEGEAENEVRPAGEALDVGVEEQDERGEWREHEREAIQLRSGEDEDAAQETDEAEDEVAGEMSGGKARMRCADWRRRGRHPPGD